MWVGCLIDVCEFFVVVCVEEDVVFFWSMYVGGSVIVVVGYVVYWLGELDEVYWVFGMLVVNGGFDCLFMSFGCMMVVYVVVEKGDVVVCC